MTAISSNDCILPFYFRSIAARGAIVKIQNSYVEALNGHQYSMPINNLLGECLMASCLMGTHLKSSARLAIQARALNNDTQINQAPVSMLIAETHVQKEDNYDSSQQLQKIRGLARINAERPLSSTDADLGTLLGRSQLAVTIEPDTGERYQGIVNAQASSLAKSLEDYFLQSEQLDTRFYLFVGETQCAGMMMQEMPNHGGKSERHPIGFTDEEDCKRWEELLVLAHSIKQEELFNLTPEECLHRLFHQHEYAIADPTPVQFGCRCSREGTINAIRIIDYQELNEILNTDGEVALDCEFCSTRYRFDHNDIASIKGLPDSGDTIN